MKKLLILALATTSCLALCGCSTETREQKMVRETAEQLAQYDLDKDGVLSEQEQRYAVQEIYKESTGEFSAEEFESAIAEAQDILGAFDTDEDGNFSYEEKLSLVQTIYEYYDRGEIKDGMFKTFLEGYERKVNELNSYYDLFEELGMPGPNIQIELRKEDE